MSDLRITDVARITGTNQSTLRLWEQHGLLTPKRSSAGQRIYSDEDVSRIRAIQRMRKVDGLNMSAIRKAIFQGTSLVIKHEELSDIPSQLKSSSANAPVENSLGGCFRLARQKAGFSLKASADATGLPLSLISTFERTSQGATVASLQLMASCYGTTVTELTRGIRSDSAFGVEVVKAGSENAVPSFGSGISILQLANTLDLLDCQKWILQPGAESSGFYAHAGEEFIHVLSGAFQISIENSGQKLLGPGDSISFESTRPHAWKACGSAETVLLWVNTPKSF